MSAAIKCEFSKGQLIAMMEILEQGKAEFGSLSKEEEGALLKIKKILRATS